MSSNIFPARDDVRAGGHLLDGLYPEARRVSLPNPDDMATGVKPECEIFGVPITIVNHEFANSHFDSTVRRNYVDFYYTLPDGELCYTRTAADAVCRQLIAHARKNGKSPYSPVAGVTLDVFPKATSEGWFLKLVKA